MCSSLPKKFTWQRDAIPTLNIEEMHKDGVIMLVVFMPSAVTVSTFNHMYHPLAKVILGLILF